MKHNLTMEEQFFESIFSFWDSIEKTLIPSFTGFLLFFFLACLILIPINVFFAQRHARLCRDELRKQSTTLISILTVLEIRPLESQHEEE